MNLVERVLDLTLAIQQIPAPTFAEHKRAEFVRQQFEAEGLADISIDEQLNVYGRLPGTSDQKMLVVSAHTDTVFPIETNLTATRTPSKIDGPGIGDNSAGVAGLFGLLWTLRESNTELPGDLWLVANSCEEGLGNLLGMRAVVDRFGPRPLAYIVLEGMAFGRVYNRGLSVKRYKISVQTPGGHSWIGYGTPSAVHELAKLVTKLDKLKLPKKPRSSLNVGVIHGGTSINTIAAEASLELDLRSESYKQLQKQAQQVERLVDASGGKDVRFEIEVLGERPAGELPARHKLVRLALAALESQGVEGQLNIGSTDANIPLSKGYPAVCIGLAHGGGAHTTGEFMLTAELERGLAQLVELVRTALTEL